MKKFIKVILIIFGIVVFSLVLDLICIFTLNRPIFAIKLDNGDSVNLIYRGIFYDTYNCHEYSNPQIKMKGSKFNCATLRADIGEVIKIVGNIKKEFNYSCDEDLGLFYVDDAYEYYFDCKKMKSIIVKYESGFEESVSDALKYGTITISDLDKYDIDYIKNKKGNN